jgi:hypothetical protein
MNKLSKITQHRQGTYIQKLFDPVQTHAIYGVSAESLLSVKKELKEAGATHFRVLTPRSAKYLRIICFKYLK